MQITWKNCFKIIISILVLYLCITYSKAAVSFLGLVLAAATPLFIGATIAYVVNIVMTFYERHFFVKSKKKIVAKLRRPICMVLAYLSLVIAAGAVIGLIVPQLISCFKLIMAYVPGVVKYFVAKVEKLNIVPNDILGFLSGVNWETYVGDIVEFLASGAGSVVEVVLKTVISVFTGVATAFVSIIFSVYLLFSKNRISNQIRRALKRYLPQKAVSKTHYVVHVVDESFHRYIVAQCTEALILGALCTIGMFILGLPYPAMIGALVGFTALVPIVGAFIGAAVGAFMILTVSPLDSLVFLIFILVLQQLEENLIYPRVVGSSVNLPGIWVLAAITVGGGVMGVLGMFVAVPIVAAIYRIVKDDVSKHEITEIKPTQAD